ncbi:MAG: site-specific integrase, partial [Candidatus Thorarchaeota archaeon]
MKIIRLKQLSPRTEKTYLSWVRSFSRFIGSRSPDGLSSKHVKNYLTFLAAEKRVSASTQNSAFNALLFFYHYILESDIGDIKNVVSKGLRIKSTFDFFGKASQRSNVDLKVRTFCRVHRSCRTLRFNPAPDASIRQDAIQGGGQRPGPHPPARGGPRL